MPKTRGKSKRLRGKGTYYAGGRTLRGRGGFFEDVGRVFKSAAGPMLGAFGAAADAVFPGSGLIASGIRRLIGCGAYSGVRSNAILASPVPRVGSSSDRGIHYSNCEFLGDVTGSTDWELTQFHVNPGLPEVFPWLSGVAGNFQKYRIDGLVFYLKSTSSVAIASSTDLGLGTVLGGFQYNVYDKAPSSKLEFLSLSGSVSGKPSEDHIYPLECDRSKNVFGNLLVRTVGVADDMAKYDHAVFNLATVGFPGEYYLGELWVSYNVTLMAPKVEQNSAYLVTNAESSGSGDPEFFSCEKISGSTPPAFSAVPPLANMSATSQSMGWSTGVSNAGLPCVVVPAGTSGYYFFRMFGRVTGGELSTAQFSLRQLDETGTVEAVAQPVSWANQFDGLTGTSTATAVFHIVALPDRPLHLLITLTATTGVTGATASVDAFRLPEKLFAASGSGAVTLAQKIHRIRTKRSQAGAALRGVAAEKKEQSPPGAQVGLQAPVAIAVQEPQWMEPPPAVAAQGAPIRRVQGLPR